MSKKKEAVLESMRSESGTVRCGFRHLEMQVRNLKFSDAELDYLAVQIEKEILRRKVRVQTLRMLRERLRLNQ